MPSRTLLGASACVLALVAPTARGASRGPAFPVNGLGCDFADLSSSDGAPLTDPTASDTNPLYLRLEVLWASVEAQPGVFDWSRLDAVVDRFIAAKHKVILDLWGGNPLYSEDILRPPTAKEPTGVEAWERFVREAARHYQGRVRFFQIGKTPNAAAIWGGEDAARSSAFLIKKSAVIVRAEAKGAAVVLGGLAGGDGAWLTRFYDEGTAPYVDVVSFRPDARKDLASQLEAVSGAVLAKDASARIWAEAVQVVGTGDEAGSDMVRKLLTAFDHGAGLVTFALAYGPVGAPVGGEFLVRAHSAIGEGLGRVPSADRIRFEDEHGAPIAAVRAVSFSNPDKGISVTGFWAEEPGAPTEVLARLTARRPGPPTLYDPIAGRETKPPFEPAEGGAKGRVPLSATPAFLVYREGVGAVGAPEGSESLEVSAERGITAEEVIAKYREFQAAQDARLTHYRSDAMINFHFKLAGYSQTIDVGMAGTYFYDPKVGAEWELRDYFLNGNKSRWKEFPELPLIQPEKVVTLPLDVTFDRSYTYEYAGEETIEGRSCHVLAFEPVDPAKTLYRGRVWIDKSVWSRVRVASIQNKLEPPFLSSEERTTYQPVPGSDGFDHWVISRIDGQQIYSASGRSFVVLRDIVFTNHVLNDPGFAAERERAYESNHQILRDTEKGFRYLEKTETGERRLKENMDTNQFFGLVGILDDPSLKTAVPLAGVNYFDYDFKGTGIQTNLFFAGALLSLNATDPNVGGIGLDVGADLFLSALGRTDKEFESGEEVEERNVKKRKQSVSVNFGREIGDFVKLRTTYELAYQAFDTDEDTSRSFILPRDTIVHTSALGGTFSRSGYEVRASASYSVRRRFAFWGRPSGEDFVPVARGFYKYELGASKEYFLPAFQKLRFAAEGYGGRDLDRFSRYTFDRFGARVRGFAGSGVRFDNGLVLRGAYVFNVANAIRFDAAVDHARTQTKGSAGATGDHTGIGIAANVLGPWKTVWQLDVGYALRSDVDAVEGDKEFLFVVLKLF